VQQLLNHIKWGTRWALAGTGASNLIQLVQIAWFARVAGPQAAGDYALAAAAVGILAPVAEAGLGQAIVQSQQVTARQIAAVTWLNWGLSLFFFAILSICAPQLSAWFGSREAGGLAVLMGASMLTNPLGAAYGGLLTKKMRFHVIARIEIGAAAVSFLTTAALLGVGWGAWAMAWGFLVRNVVATLGCVVAGRDLAKIRIFVFFTTKGHKRTQRGVYLADFRSVVPLLRFGAYETGGRWTDFLFSQSDKLLVAKLLGLAALGHYHLAHTFLLLPAARIGAVLARVAFPAYALPKSRREQNQAVFDRFARQTVLLLFPLYLGIALISPEALRLFLRADWAPAAELVWPFACIGLLHSLIGLFQPLVKGLGHPEQWLVVTLALAGGISASVFLVLWLWPTGNSAAWARLAATALVGTFLCAWMAKQHDVSLRQALGLAMQMLLRSLPFVFLAQWSAGHVENLYAALALKTVVFGLGTLHSRRHFNTKQPHT
jgi:O-antigen/teichoic acid export membrane protein